MRKIFDVFVGLAFFALILGAVAWTGELENTYEMNCEVVSTSNHETVLLDPRGELWVVEDDSFKLNDEVEVRFHTNFTEHNFKDDTIRWVKPL